jgi:hypothetical protein
MWMEIRSGESDKVVAKSRYEHARTCAVMLKNTPFARTLLAMPHVMPRHATLRYATPRCATPRHATPRHATPFQTNSHSVAAERCESVLECDENQSGRHGGQRIVERRRVLVDGRWATTASAVLLTTSGVEWCGVVCARNMVDQ